MAVPTGGTDLLTHTTLKLDHDSSSAAIADMIRALQRVPGVLFARVDATSDRAVVGHDAAVPLTSLVRAAASTGVRAGLVAAPAIRVDGEPGATGQRAPVGRQLIIWAAVLAAVTMVETLTFNTPERRWLLPTLLTLFWVTLLTVRAIASRRP
jgi:hypothetical protein